MEKLTLFVRERLIALQGFRKEQKQDSGGVLKRTCMREDLFHKACCFSKWLWVAVRGMQTTLHLTRVTH